MEFNGSIEINKNRRIVTRYFSDPQYLKEYQEGFLRKELVKGESGKNGAVSKMYYQNGKHEMELVETIDANLLPEQFEATYHHKHMDNTMKCTFIELDENRTRYNIEIVYTRIDWVMPRLMAILFPGMFRKPAQRWLDNFKALVEKRGQ